MPPSAGGPSLLAIAVPLSDKTYGSVSTSPKSRGSSSVAMAAKAGSIGLSATILVLSLAVFPMIMKRALVRFPHAVLITAMDLVVTPLLYFMLIGPLAWALHLCCEQPPVKASSSSASISVWRVWCHPGLGWLGLTGVAYALRIAVNNVALQHSGVKQHVLLSATSLMWIALFARVFLKERASRLQMLALLVMVAGAALGTLGTSPPQQGRQGRGQGQGQQGFPGDFFLGLALNLLAPLLDGVVVTMLRLSSVKILAPATSMESPNNRSFFDVLSFVAAKFAFAAAVVLPFAFATNDVPALLFSRPASLPAADLIACIAVDIVYQVALVVVIHQTSAVFVGIVCALKVAPQLLADAVITQRLPHWTKIISALLVLAGAVVFKIGALAVRARSRRSWPSQQEEWQGKATASRGE